MSDFGSQPPSPPPPPPPPSLTPPPGYVAYGGRGSVPAGTQSVRGLAKALVVLLTIYAPLQLLGLVGTWQMRQKARDFLAGRLTDQEFTDATRRNIGSLGSILVIPIAVLTMILMYRMATNLRAIGRTTKWAPGWAIGGWFCPPCAIYAIPWLMFRELWRGSDPDVAPHDTSWTGSRVSPLVTVWWVLYGLVPLVGIGTAANTMANFRKVDNDALAKTLNDFATLNIVLGVVGVGTTLVYLQLVRTLAARHRQLIGDA